MFRDKKTFKPKEQQQNIAYEPSLKIILTPYPKDYTSHSVSSLEVTAVNML